MTYLPRRAGHVEVIHISSGKRGTLVHRSNETDRPLVYARVTAYATCNWPRRECMFRFVPKEI